MGGVVAQNMVALSLEIERKTLTNIKAQKAFTLAVPDTDTLKQSDYLGTASSSNTPDKFERSELHAHKSERVDAPIIEGPPITLEYKLVEVQTQPYSTYVLDETVSTRAADAILDERGRSTPARYASSIRYAMATMRSERRSAKPGMPG
ncbi:MAG: flavin reductase [Coriobacteriaceae bacterium]